MRIDVTNLSKIIRGSVILDNISIHFESGHIYGIIGKNGSGKTMLLRAISGLIVPSSGVVYVDGKALGTEISFPPEIGILIEKPEFLGHLSGFENLKMLSEIKWIFEHIQSFLSISFVTLSNSFFITGKQTYPLYVSRTVKPRPARHTGTLSRDLVLVFSYPVRVGAAHRPRGTPARRSPSPKWDHAPK